MSSGFKNTTSNQIIVLILAALAGLLYVFYQAKHWRKPRA